MELFSPLIVTQFDVFAKIWNPGMLNPSLYHASDRWVHPTSQFAQHRANVHVCICIALHDVVLDVGDTEVNHFISAWEGCYPCKSKHYEQPFSISRKYHLLVSNFVMITKVIAFSDRFIICGICIKRYSNYIAVLD